MESSYDHIPKVVILHREDSHPKPLLDLFAKLHPNHYNNENRVW